MTSRPWAARSERASSQASALRLEIATLAPRGQLLGDRAADAAGRAGHQGDLSL